MFKPELLSPAGTLKNMRYAFAYGADAVYAGQPRYSLRVRNNEFNHENLQTGINEAHALGKKFYVLDDRLILSFSDSGPGVSDEQLTHLFNRFYRAEGSRNRASGGSGLGLSICQNIVTAHGGTLHASHSPLGGVTITVELPLETCLPRIL